MGLLGFDLRSEASLETLTLDIVKTTEIEGEIIDRDQVRSSLARRLGMNIAGLVPSDRYVDGIVDMMLDAVQHSNRPLTEDRLLGWHASLFPSGRSGMYSIAIGAYREDCTGPMQVVSGAMGKERVHFQAPASDRVPSEMKAFLDWMDSEATIDPVIKAGIAHFWFVTIHPFDDGNGRIARAITDLLLTRADEVPHRYYSMSARIQKERSSYYHVLEFSQKGTLDITNWLSWFLDCLTQALINSEEIVSKVLLKHRFWVKHAQTNLNDRQVAMLNRILDGFRGKVTSSKWAKITKTSADTALRDIQDLMQKNILLKAPSGGRNTSYVLKEDEI